MFTIDLDDIELMVTAPGRRVAFPLNSASGTASTATVLFELDPGAELPMHTDSAEELLVVMQGTAEARIGDDVDQLVAHHVALVPAMARHGIRNVGDDVLRVFGTFSSSTVVSTFEEPFEPGGPRLFVIGAPMPVALPLAEPAFA